MFLQVKRICNMSAPLISHEFQVHDTGTVMRIIYGMFRQDRNSRFYALWDHPSTLSYVDNNVIRHEPGMCGTVWAFLIHMQTQDIEKLDPERVHWVDVEQTRLSLIDSGVF